MSQQEFRYGGLRTWVVAVVGFMVAVSSSHVAQAQTAAYKEALAKMRRSQKQHGSIGSGYRPFSAWAYHNSARMHARTLNSYGQNVTQLPPHTATEHLDAIRKDVASTKSEISKLGDDAARDLGIKNEVDTLVKHLAECEQLCATIQKTIGKDTVESGQMCVHCTALEEKLKATEMEHRSLLKKLEIEVPSDHVEHQPSKAEGTPAKKEK